MRVVLVYIAVVLIWSTTPLAIKWSNNDVGFMAAVSLRMLLAAILAVLLLALLRRRLFAEPGVWKFYFIASLGLFPAMPMVYWSAQHISSGMLALIFSMTPIFTGLVSIVVLRTNPFTPTKILALLLAIAGLLVIFMHQIQFSVRAGGAIFAALTASAVMGGSSVILKRLDSTVGSLQQTAGALIFALPSLLLSWWLWGDPWPTQVHAKTLYSLMYLVVFGSLLGFTFYYYLLRNISPISLSLVTLMTPVLALYLGHLLAAEPLSLTLLVGAGMIILALALYQGIFSRRRNSD